MKEQILTAAVKMATKQGYKNVTRDGLADTMGVAAGAITYHYENMRKLRNAIIETAIQSENIKIFTEALVDRHPLAIIAPQRLKDLAARALRA